MKSLDNQLTAKKRVLLGVLELLHNIPVEELVGTCSPTPALDHAYKSTCMRLRDEYEELDLVYVGGEGKHDRIHLGERRHLIGTHAHTLCGLLGEFGRRESVDLKFMCPTCHTQALHLLK